MSKILCFAMVISFSSAAYAGPTKQSDCDPNEILTVHTYVDERDVKFGQVLDGFKNDVANPYFTCEKTTSTDSRIN
jgi:hypothetical protein